MSLINGKVRKWTISIFLFCLVCFSCALRPSAAGNVVATAKTAGSGQWKTDENGKRYCLDKNGKSIKNAWRKINGGIYRFDELGYVKTGWFKYSGQKYYADASGKLYVSKWAKKGKKYYFLGANGVLAKKTVVKYKKQYYYVDKSGARVTNTWITSKGKKYYYDQNGVRLQNKWIKDNGKFYYLGSSGAMAIEQWVDGGKSYVGADGAMKTNCVVDGYYLNAKGRKTVKPFKGDYIFVGDSRTEGMRLAVSSKDTMYIAKVSMGYSWLKSTAGPKLQNYLDANPNVTVVLAFGVNDLGNIDNYISYYKTLIAKYRKTKFYVMSVNPVDEAQEAVSGYKVKNSQISSFNKKMKSGIGKEKFLNTYKYLKKKGFTSRDGVHYSSNDYRNIYNYVIKKIGK